MVSAGSAPGDGNNARAIDVTSIKANNASAIPNITEFNRLARLWQLYDHLSILNLFTVRYTLLKKGIISLLWFGF